MEILKVTSQAFRKYGRVIEGYDFEKMIKEMEHAPLPEDVIYVPSVEGLEALEIAKDLSVNIYGELPIQIGYCNGKNTKLNALEYHRSSEVNVAVTDLILLLGMEQDVEEDYTYDTSKVEAFLVPEGTVVEVYGTTLHYAPCSVQESGFKCVVVLPKDTNMELAEKHQGAYDDKLLTAKNKWLIAHEEAGIAGAFVGLKGENIDLSK